jgi:hypothetical protein
MFFGLIDWFFRLGVNQSSLSKKIEAYRAFSARPSYPAILAELSTLDAKSNSLLQHVSIMIASLSALLAINSNEAIQNSNEAIKTILLCNIAGYLLVVLMTLRVIVSVNFTNDPEAEAEEKLLRELKTRERYYLTAHTLASVLTTIFLFFIIAYAVAHA